MSDIQRVKATLDLWTCDISGTGADFEFCEDGTVFLNVPALDYTAGQEHIELSTDQRRALLAHLLEAEGLPGVEEILKLRADVDNSYSEGYEVGFAEGYDNGSEDGYERGYEQGLSDGPEPDDTALARIRQARLSELLEAEARERVELKPLPDGRVSIRCGQTKTLPISLHGWTEEQLWERVLIESAALAEKRRREREISVPLEEFVDRLGIREEFDEAKRESEVSDG